MDTARQDSKKINTKLWPTSSFVSKNWLVANGFVIYQGRKFQYTSTKNGRCVKNAVKSRKVDSYLWVLRGK